MAEHDVFNCDCHETCSWCTEPVLYRSLAMTNDGAMLCRDCWADYRKGR